MCFLFARVSMAGARPIDAVGSMARAGMHRRGLVFGALLATVVASVLVSCLLACVAVLGAGGTPGMSVLGELTTVCGIGLLAGWAYASLFVAASTVGKNGAGRRWFLLLDWVLGTGATAVALPWPRAHTRNLLGLDAVVGMPQWSAALMLAALATVSTAWVTFRTPS